MDSLARMPRDQGVHKAEELSPPSALIVFSGDLPGSDIKCRKQGTGSVLFVVMRLAGDRPAIGQLEISLAPLQRLDRGLLIHRKHHSMVRRHHVKANDVRRLGGEFRGGALAPGWRLDRSIFWARRKRQIYCS